MLVLVGSLTTVKASEKPIPEINKNVCIVSDGTEVKGKVIDKINNEPLVGVEITLLDCDLKVYTDMDGNFVIKNINSGAHVLKVDYISYQSKIENIYIKDQQIDNPYLIRIANVKN
jgi:hypothetical protein